MNALITGGNGFIGSHLTDLLACSGWQVCVLDRRERRFDLLPKTVRHVRGDIASAELIRERLRGTDVVFHLSCSTIPATSNDNLAFDLQTNVLASVNFLHECVRAGVRRVVFLSSGGTVYGVAQELPIPESHSTAPICSHGLTKLTIERYLALFHRLHGLEFAVLRCGNAYGERQDPTGRLGAVSVFLGRLAAGQPVTIWGDGSVVRDFVHVRDVATACLVAAISTHTDLTVNIGSGRPVSLQELVRRIEGVTGRTVGIRWREGRPADVPAVVLRISQAAELLGWEPQIPLDEGLVRTWEWVNTLPEADRWVAQPEEPAFR
jgi:UDP-glucose 4-epimerase